MKFRLIIFGLLSFIFISRDICAQNELTQKEILNEYRTNQIIPKLDSIFRWDIHLRTRATLDNLLNRGVDTLLIYSISLPGYSYIAINDSCSYSYPVSSYFFWKEDGKYFFNEATGRCESQTVIADQKVIKFVVDNYSKIKDEFFMEAISGAKRNGEHLQVSASWVDHEPKYSILLFVNSQYEYLTFTENGLTNKRGLFLDYNRELTSYRLFKILDAKTRGK